MSGYSQPPHGREKGKSYLPASPQQIAQAAKAHFGEDVLQISAPGGQDRASVRVVLSSQSVIATQRPDPRGFELERHLLQQLSNFGAPVPNYLGHCGAILFQQDVGRARLSTQLASQPGAHVTAVAQAAFDSLWRLKEAADRAGLTSQMPVLAMSNDWLTPFCQRPAMLSRQLALPVPALDIAALAAALVRPPNQFVKWDTRPGNAAVQADGRVIWFDWEHAGRRAGPEDFSFLAGDEFWPLGAAASLALYANGPQPITPLSQAFLICFTSLQIVQRIEMIRSRVAHSGWTEAARAMRYDKIGADPALLRRLLAHGADWAARDPRVAPLAPWFSHVGEAITALVPLQTGHRDQP